MKVQFRLRIEHQFSIQRGEVAQRIPKAQMLHGSHFCQRPQPSFLITKRTVNMQQNGLIWAALCLNSVCGKESDLSKKKKIKTKKKHSWKCCHFLAVCPWVGLLKNFLRLSSFTHYFSSSVCLLSPSVEAQQRQGPSYLFVTLMRRVFST